MQLNCIADLLLFYPNFLTVKDGLFHEDNSDWDTYPLSDLREVSLALQSSIKNGNAKILVWLHEGLSETVLVIEIFYYFFLILAVL